MKIILALVGCAILVAAALFYIFIRGALSGMRRGV